MMENIKDLNVLAGEGISRIQRTTDGARLKVRTFKMKISQLPSMICYRYIFIKSQKFLFSSFAQVNFHLMMPTSELFHTFYTITRQFQMSCYKVALGVWFGEFWMCGKVYVTSNLVSTPASVFPQQIQTKFIHKLYMNNISVKFGNHYLSCKILRVMSFEHERKFENVPSTLAKQFSNRFKPNLYRSTNQDNISIEFKNHNFVEFLSLKMLTSVFISTLENSFSTDAIPNLCTSYIMRTLQFISYCPPFIYLQQSKVDVASE